MYYECRICQRVTDHRERKGSTGGQTFATSLGLSEPVYLICPHCNTGVSGRIISVLGSREFSIGPVTR